MKKWWDQKEAKPLTKEALMKAMEIVNSSNYSASEITEIISYDEYQLVMKYFDGTNYAEARRKALEEMRINQDNKKEE